MNGSSGSCSSVKSAFVACKGLSRGKLMYLQLPPIQVREPVLKQRLQQFSHQKMFRTWYVEEMPLRKQTRWPQHSRMQDLRSMTRKFQKHNRGQVRDEQRAKAAARGRGSLFNHNSRKTVGSRAVAPSRSLMCECES